MDENNIIKKAYQKDSYSRKREEELEKCMNDPMYFIKNYLIIQHATKGRVQFKPFPFQEEMIREFQNNRFTIALTARQMGKCCFSNTNIKCNDDKIEIGSLISLSLKERIVAWLENKLLYLTK